jgi:hypothetical protein
LTILKVSSKECLCFQKSSLPMVDVVLPYNDWRSARYIHVYSETTTIPNTQGKVTSAQLAEGIMLDLWRDFCIRENGTGQQVAQLHHRYMMMILYPNSLGWSKSEMKNFFQIKSMKFVFNICGFFTLNLQFFVQVWVLYYFVQVWVLHYFVQVWVLHSHTS